jgi:hypothetical protein
LDWHLDWYVKDGAEKYTKAAKPILYQAQGGSYRLTTYERKRILLNNIYGVDIDPQAVEVTKLSLLLKVLEGENSQTLDVQFKLFHERALPDLASNIKCGNSLIGPDFYQQQSLNLFNDEERLRINAFDWNTEFADIMNSGGFDAVIGNPPYIRIQMMKEWAPIEVEFYKEAYASAAKGNYDIYVVFVERGLSLLNNQGRLGFILPHKFFNSQYGEPLRKMLAEGKHLSHIVHFGDQQVFEGATTYTCLMFLNKASQKQCDVVKVYYLDEWRNSGIATEGKIPAASISSSEWNFAVGSNAKLFEKLRKIPVKLEDIAHLFVGLQTDADDVFILEEIRQEKNRVLCKSKSTGQEHWFENEHLKPFLKGSLNIRRYYLSNVTKRLIFPYESRDGKSVLIDPKEYEKSYPLTWAYLEENKELLSKREKGRMGQEWYGYVYKKNHTRFAIPKLLVPSISTGSCFAADMDGKYYFVGSGGGGGGGYAIVFSIETRYSYLYLLGILNSSLLNTYLKTISTPFRGGYIALNRQYIGQLPVCPINFSDPSEKARHDKMVSLVDQMLSLNKQLPSVKTDHEKTALQRQIDATDKQIDELVYELYGITEEERKIIEESK